MESTTDEKIDRLDCEVLTQRDLRVAAKVALLCNDHRLAQALRQLHDLRATAVKGTVETKQEV